MSSVPIQNQQFTLCILSDTCTNQQSDTLTNYYLKGEAKVSTQNIAHSEY